MAVCSSCGTDNDARSRFCSKCGSFLKDSQPVVYCTSCGTENSGSARFCINCGLGLSRLTRMAPDTLAHAAPEYMGFWARFVASIIDDIVLVIGIFVLGFMASVFPYIVILYVPLVLYLIYKHVKGKTIGRRLLNMEVVAQSGEAIGFWRGLLRETVGKLVSSIFFYLGFIWIAFDRQKQGWHDKIASTYVVRRANVVSRPVPQGSGHEDPFARSDRERAGF